MYCKCKLCGATSEQKQVVIAFSKSAEWTITGKYGLLCPNCYAMTILNKEVVSK